MDLIRLLIRNWLSRVLLFVYVALFVFWINIYLSGSQEGFINNLFGALYPLISLSGGIFGLVVVSKKWGGMKSLIGRGVIFLSLGLLAEVFGQWAWSYFVVIKQVELPYPSIADFGYFLIVPFYALAMYNFAKASGVRVGLKSMMGKLQAIAIPVLMIVIAYTLFLQHVEVDLSNPLRTFLDFGYPGFEAIAISIGILTYSLSVGVLGGVMKPRILYLVFALVAQYITDYTFLYQVGTETYYNGGIVDLMYMTSLLIMSLGVISLNKIEENHS